MEKKVFPGKYKILAEISDFVSRHAKNAGLNENEIYAVQLAVDEACTNIIEHGYGGEGKGNIECICTVLPDGIEIVLQDTGKYFDPKDAPAPMLNVPLEELKSRGAGIYLMHNVMDEINYQVGNDKKNILKLIKKKAR